MLIKTLFQLAAAQDDKTNFVRLWQMIDPENDLDLYSEIMDKYPVLIVQSMMELRNEISSITAFEDITEALNCIVYQKPYAGPKYNADLDWEDTHLVFLRDDYPWIFDGSDCRFGGLPPKLVKPEEAFPRFKDQIPKVTSDDEYWCENNWVWVKKGEDPAAKFRSLWDRAMTETIK